MSNLSCSSSQKAGNWSHLRAFKVVPKLQSQKTKGEPLEHTREPHNGMVEGSQRKARGLGKVGLNFS